MGSLLKRSYRLSIDLKEVHFSKSFQQSPTEMLIKGTLPEEFLEILRESTGESLDLVLLKKDVYRGEGSESVRLVGEATAVDFECGPFDCATVLSKDPRLVVELLMRDEVIAIASVPLGQLTDLEGIELWATLFQMNPNVHVAMAQKGAELGQVLIEVTLHDLGIKPSLKSQPQIKVDRQPPLHLPKYTGVQMSEEKIREEIKTRAEREMEIWKRQETEKHMLHLEELQAERMAFLEEEWRRHELQREADIQSLKAKLQDALQKATSTLKDTEERERKVHVLQESMIRRRKDLERQHVTRLQESEDALARLQKDFEHHLSLERDKAKEVLSKSAHSKQQLKAAEDRAELLEREILQLKKSNVQSSVLVLEQELDVFKKMHATAQERIVVLEQEKERFKARVLELAQQLAVLQSKPTTAQTIPEAMTGSQNQSTHPVHSQHQPHLRKEPIVEEIEALKEELQVLKVRAEEREAELPASDSCNHPWASDVQTRAENPAPSQSEAPQSEELRQVLQNKKELLATGVYSEEDELIKELDKRIRALAQSS